jgi:hypothetical protein
MLPVACLTLPAAGPARMSIEPSVDAYGNKSRASAAADWLELLAWHDDPTTFAAAADYLGDLGDAELTRLPDETHEDLQDEEADFADRMRSVIQDRADLLGSRYPFAMLNEGLAIDPNPDPQSALYLLFLSITVAHAYDCQTTGSPEELFQAAVARCLDPYISTVDLGSLRRTEDTFEDAVITAGTTVGLSAAPHAASAAASAQDEGVDTICHWDWGDRRVGRWIAIGQATCGQSTSWSAKLAEPRPGVWATRLGDYVNPFTFLAVPHHVERRFLQYLVENNEATVVDRIRLVLCDRDLLADEEQIVTEVYGCPVQSP